MTEFWNVLDSEGRTVETFLSENLARECAGRLSEDYQEVFRVKRGTV